MVDPAQIIRGLVQRGVPLPAAIGITGNLGVESRYDPGINEIAPLVPGSRGGFGLSQWTGPRRRQLEAFAGDRVADLDTQLDFLVHELNTTESRARDAIFSARDPVEAARLTSERFLRPGIPHLQRRLEEARKLANTYRDMPQQQPRPQQPQNALAQPPQLPEMRNSLSADAFMLPVPVAPPQNALALNNYDQFLR